MGVCVETSLRRMSALADSRGGVCLSGSYTNAHTKLLWRCAHGHAWEATPNTVQRGRWCPFCANRRGLSIETLRDMAQRRGGTCLSGEYRGMGRRYEWRCSLGHTWHSIASGIKDGAWCPTCARSGSSLGERLSRAVLERMFGEAFEKRRPSWAQGPRGRALELDGLARSGRVAFEYNGPHHYGRDARYSAAATEEQQLRDRLKLQACSDRGVTLVVIPEFSDLRDLQQCIAEVEQAVLRAGLSIPETWLRPERLDEIWHPLVRLMGERRMRDLLAFVVDRGGQLLTGEAPALNAPLLWRCGAGHEWSAPAHRVLSGKWCLQCNGKPALGVADMHRLAEARRGAFVSPEYVNALTKHRWRCGAGHEWEATPNSVQQGYWCPDCGGTKRKTPEHMRRLAANRGGEFLSQTYLGANIKHRWRCDSGHEWEATPSSIQQGTWCRPCSFALIWENRRGRVSLDARGERKPL